MRFAPTRLIAPLVAAVLLVLIVHQTVGALRATGVWERHRAPAPAASPYAPIERLLASAPAERTAPLRDPFDYARAPAPTPARRPAAARVVAPPAPARPVLTAIVWLESNPSATIRWNGRDYPVQTNTLFDEFRVRSIARDQVILEHAGETLVLQLPKKGD